jgi:TPR repeat protein
MNRVEASKYFKLAADQGVMDVQHHYAIRLLVGDGVSVNHAEAAQYFRFAADQDLHWPNSFMEFVLSKAMVFL